MPIVIDEDLGEEEPGAGEPYATIADVRAAYTTDATDEEVTNAIEFASALVDARGGRSFYPLTTQTVHGQSTGTIVLPVPGTVTEVKIGDTIVDPVAYDLTPWGVQFKSDWRGTYYDTARPLTVEPIRFRNGRYNVTVTGTFGQLSPLITEATVLLAIDRLKAQSGEASSSAIPEMPSNVTSLSVEGLSVSLRSDGSSSTTGLSTGNITADRLIDLVAMRPIGVA